MRESVTNKTNHSAQGKKKIFGFAELFFDIIYLVTGLIIAIFIIRNLVSRVSVLALVATLILIIGDCFHLIPRIVFILSGKAYNSKVREQLGFGKFIASLSMTMFYVILWHLGVGLLNVTFSPVITLIAYILAFARILICLSPKNNWTEETSPLSWRIARNVPFVLLGLQVALMFAIYHKDLSNLKFMWIAIALSFLFYIPVVMISDKKPIVGMLMLPKTIMYIWILFMLLTESMAHS